MRVRNSDLEKIKSSIKIGDREFISYASDWDLYEGEINWDDLSEEKQNEIIHSYLLTDRPLEAFIMELGLQKKDFDGLHMTLVGTALALENNGINKYDDNWSKRQLDLVRATLGDTLIGERIRQIQNNHEGLFSPVYSAELCRFSDMKMYEGLCFGSLNEVEARIKFVYSVVPDDEEIEQICNINAIEKPNNYQSADLFVLFKLSESRAYDYEEIDQFSEGLICDSYLYAAFKKFKKVGLINFAPADEEPWYEPNENEEEALDEVLYGPCKIWLTPRGKEIADNLKPIAIKRIDELKKNKQVSDKRQAGRIEKTKAEQVKLDAEIKANGGYLVESGLYHGERRVRAKLGWLDGWNGHHDEWVLSPDETDLISALGVDKFNSNVNPVDLRNRFGLEIRKELAPVKTAISEGDYLEVIRTDKWGEGAKEYIDKRTLYQKIGCENWKEWALFIAFFHVMLMMWLMEKLSSRSQKVFGNIFFMSTFIIFSLFLAKTEGDLSSLGLLFSLYLTLPTVVAMFQAHIGADEGSFRS